MKIYDLYLSGLFYGTVEFRENSVYHEKINVFTGAKEEKTLVTQRDNEEYQSLFHIDMLSLGEKLSSFETAIRGAEDGKARTQAGELFSRWDQDNPYTEELWVQRNVKYPLDLAVEQGRVAGIIVPSRESIAVLAEQGKEKLAVLKDWKAYSEAAELTVVKEQRTELVPMRDGVRLSTQVILPQTSQKAPTLFVRTPYGKELLTETYYRYVRRGYCVVIQDVRGRNDSEGEWRPMFYEREDGDDSLNWIAAQSWSDGSVGMIGGSYLGYVQWAAAASGNPHLKALISIVTAGSPFGDLPRRGGVLNSGMLAWAFAMSQRKFAPELMLREDWDEVMDIRPLSKIGEQALGSSIPFFEEWIESYDNGSMWEQMDWSLYKKQITVPAFIMSGWYDDNGMGTTEALSVTQDYIPGQRKALLGPWVHSGNASRDIHGVALGDNALRYDVDLLFLKWLDKHLKGISNGIEKAPMVEYYTVGSEMWKTAENWPIPDCRILELFLSRNYGLSQEPELWTGFYEYTYDPDDPAPYLIDMSENECGVPGNYKEVDLRDDVLVFETPPLPDVTTVTGDLQVELYAGSDAPDTDWIVKLEDVDSAGNAVKLADGVLAARYRNGFSGSRFMQPGEVYCFKITTSKISAAVGKGHRLRLTVTSGAKNFCFPNSNTEQGYNSEEKQVAHNRIYYGGMYPSKVGIPVEMILSK